MASSPPTVNQSLFGRPRFGVNEAALTFGQQGMFDGLGLSNLPAGLMEDVMQPNVGSMTPIVQQNLQPITRGGVTQYELPETLVRYQGRDGTGDIGVFPGMDYRLVDRKTGEVLTTNPQEAPALIAALNERDGKFSNWAVEQRPAGSDADWSTANQQWAEAPSGLGVLADFALPVLGAALAPLTGGSSLLMAGLGAAGGSAASSVLQGRSLQDTLLRAALSGGTAAGVGALSQGLGSAAGSAVGAKASAIPFNSVPGLNVPGISLPTFAAPSLSGIGGAVSAAVPGEILVTAPRIAASNALAAGLGGAAGGGFDQFVSDNAGMIGDAAPQADPEIEVAAPRTADPSIGAPEILLGGGTLAGLGALLSSNPGLAETVAQNIAQNSAGSSTLNSAQGTTTATKPPLSVLDYIQAGTGGLSVLSGLGGLLGIGGSGNAGGGIGGFNPNAGLVSYQPLNRTQNAPTFDPFTYGQTGGEFRFFNDAAPQFQINQPSAPAAMIAPENPNTPRFARGGPVTGIGGGQDDLIDAKLSDGEYVFSAQDVSDLGDGSNAEGARKLNQMRKLIRKGAGRKNVKTIARPQKSVSSLLEAVR